MQEKTIFALNGKKDAKLYLACFDFVRQHPQYWNKWILSDGWIHIINDVYDMTNSLKFVSTDLNRAIGKHPRFSCIDNIGESNLEGIYKALRRVPSISAHALACFGMLLHHSEDPWHHSEDRKFPASSTLDPQTWNLQL